MGIAALLEDETMIDHDILTNNDSGRSHFILPHTVAPQIGYMFRGQESSDDLSKNNNLIIVDVAEGSELVIDQVTCLSSSWQAGEHEVESWKFEDEADSGSAVDALQLVVLHGSSAELLVDNSKNANNQDDVVASNDMKYASKLLTLFLERSTQLQKMTIQNM